jgi:hypothetical protein
MTETYADLVRAEQERRERMTRARTTDPETSQEAADLADTRGSQSAVLAVLRISGPGDDKAISQRVKAADGLWSSERLRTARNELVRRGLVEWTGRTATLPSGRHARVWQAVEP